VLDFDRSRRTRSRDAAIAIAFVVAGLLLYLLPTAYQEPIRSGLQRTVLQPFLIASELIAERRTRIGDVGRIRAQRDSLLAVVTAQATLAEENRRLRSLISLDGRTGEQFVPANLLRLGVDAAESTFMISIGLDAGVRRQSPVIAPEGLLGVVREVRPGRAQAIDWTHLDFRASAMTAEGDVYGIVEPRRGRTREEDMLVLRSAPFHIDIQPGRRIVTSGRGGVFPRGILIGIVAGIEEADTGWRKSYLISPAVRPEAVTQVLVGVGVLEDLSDLWDVTAPPDTLLFEVTTSAAARAAPGGR
jgi:rod shape-determining protein MreC